MLKVNAIDNSNLMRFIAAHEDVSASTGLPRLTIVTPLYSGGEVCYSAACVAKGAETPYMHA